MIYIIENKKPVIAPSVFIAPGADIIGEVTIEEGSSVWFNCTLRGDGFPVHIGKNTNIQDNSVIHVTTNKHPSIIGNNVTIGHNVVIHGARLEDYSFIGISATIMDNVVIKKYGFVAAGALVPPNFEVPENILVAGVPARIIRELKPEERQRIEETAKDYSNRAQTYKNSLKVLETT